MKPLQPGGLNNVHVSGWKIIQKSDPGSEGINLKIYNLNFNWPAIILNKYGVLALNRLCSDGK